MFRNKLYPKAKPLYLKVPVVVHSGCCDRVPEPGWLRNKRNLFLPVLEAGKFKIKVSVDLVSGEECLLPGS